MHDSGVVDLSDTFDAAQTHAVQVHFDAQLLDIVRVAPRTVRFEELATTLLALVALPTSAMPVFRGLSYVTLRTFHLSIVLSLALHFQQRLVNQPLVNSLSFTFLVLAWTTLFRWVGLSTIQTHLRLRYS